MNPVYISPSVIMTWWWNALVINSLAEWTVIKAECIHFHHITGLAIYVSRRYESAICLNGIYCLSLFNPFTATIISSSSMNRWFWTLDVQYFHWDLKRFVSLTIWDRLSDGIVELPWGDRSFGDQIGRIKGASYSEEDNRNTTAGALSWSADSRLQMLL